MRDFKEEACVWNGHVVRGEGLSSLRRRSGLGVKLRDKNEFCKFRSGDKTHLQERILEVWLEKNGLERLGELQGVLGGR